MIRRQQGLTLIEVLIAVLVLAIGLLGIAGLQSSALSKNLVSLQYTSAATLAQGMLERMRGNRNAVTQGLYALSAGTAPPSPGTDCSSGSGACTSNSQQAAWDLAVWYYTVVGGTPPGTVPAQPQSYLPSAKVAIQCVNDPATGACSPNSAYLVTVFWNADRDPSVTGYGCNPATSTDLRCFRIAYQP